MKTTKQVQSYVIEVQQISMVADVYKVMCHFEHWKSKASNEYSASHYATQTGDTTKN